MTDRELLNFLATHFIVKNGSNSEKNQYGHLELWWAAESVDVEPNAATNPWLLLTSAEGSYSLAALGELRGVLDEARKTRR